MVRPPPFLSGRESLVNLCVFCTLRFATDPYSPCTKASSDCRVFSLLKTASKYARTYQFGDKYDFWGRGPAPPPHPTSLYGVSPLTEILNTPLLSLIVHPCYNLLAELHYESCIITIIQRLVCRVAKLFNLPCD